MTVEKSEFWSKICFRLFRSYYFVQIIPQQLCDNAGFDSTNLLNKLRKCHADGQIWAGVDVNNEGVSDNFKAFVWEPALVKINAIQDTVGKMPYYSEII